MGTTDRKFRLVMSWVKSACKSQAEANWVENLDFHHGECFYYTGEIQASGEWNDLTVWENGERRVISEIPSKAAKLLDAIGVDIVWSNSHVSCDVCGEFIPTEAAHAFDTVHFWYDGECGITCDNCLARDGEDYLKALEGRPESPLAKVDLRKYGYTQVSSTEGEYPYEYRQPDFAKMLEKLRLAGITRTLLKTHSNGPFAYSWGLWVHSTQIRKFNKRLGHGIDQRKVVRHVLSAL